MDVTIRNTGTRKLNNVRVFCDLPLNWRVEIKPDLIADPGTEQGRGRQHQVPAPGRVSVGDYEPKIRTDAVADNRRVESEDKIVRIHISLEDQRSRHRGPGPASRRPARRHRRLRHQADAEIGAKTAMWKTIVKKEILENLLSYRFPLFGLIAMVLIPLGMYVGQLDYAQTGPGLRRAGPAVR